MIKQIQNQTRNQTECKPINHTTNLANTLQDSKGLTSFELSFSIPSDTFYFLELPDNSELARAFREKHPKIYQFEVKYRNVNWRQRLV